ncbi:MAG: hypothetical protein ACRC8A_15805 [Microcoleaceae cyanobacterium]
MESSEINPELQIPDFDQADALLSNLLQEAEKWGGSLSGGQQRNLSAGAVSALFQSEVRLGNPRDNLVQLTEEIFAESGVELTDIYKQQMQSQFDFYYMTFTVDLRPQPGAQFWRLVCQLDYGPKGDTEPIIQRLFPTDQWRSVMSFGVGMDVGLDGNLSWKGSVNSSQLEGLLGALPQELKASVTTNNSFKAFLAIPAYKYELGQAEILASGEGNSICDWRITAGNLHKVGTAKFGIVFKVPKGMEAIALEAKAWAEPNMNWLTADLRDVAAELSDRFKQLLKKQEAASQFARGQAEVWNLALPKASI